ncbi:MAG: hypothetical protein C4530_24725 [Desulfobacteraceae bacterium]|nr:MAG: hypothetical protein C4530_24725 [Desulfobacteraceae bacterium]
MRLDRVKAISIVSFLVSSICFGAAVSGFYRPEMEIGKSAEKEIHQALFGPKQGKVIETRWSAFGRTDLVAFDDNPESMDIYIDGTAGTPMFRFNGDLTRPDPAVARLKTEFPGYFPFFFLKESEKETALVIGPGGGRDVFLTLMGGVKKITAVEVNQEIVDMVRAYSLYNGDIYDGFDSVEIVIDEGRNFLKRQEAAYDLILLSLPVTNTSRSREGYALTENFLLTTDSIGDYLDHLTEEGRLVVVGHGELSILRLLSLSLAALGERGVGAADGMEHIYILGSDLFPVLVLKKTPFSKEEIVPRFEEIFMFGFDPRSSYFPFIKDSRILNPALISLETGLSDFQRLEREAEKLGHEIGPVTDNRPFFYKFEKGIPKPVSAVFVISIVASFFVMTAPLLVRSKNGYKRKGCLRNGRVPGRSPIPYAIVFLMLGIGFMMAEISLIQKFVLFLGRPVMSLAVLLFSLLAGAGLGSIASGCLSPERAAKGGAAAALVAAGVLLLYAGVLPILFHRFLGLPLEFRAVISGMLLIPLGFSMGFPFPLTMRYLKNLHLEPHIPWMWGINGTGSVLGSAATIAVAIDFGYTQALVLGAGCYLIVSLILRFAR